MPGYPIRTPSDHSSVDSSPRPIAASHVLHRLLMPRHPPCALDNLTNTPTPVTQSSSKPKTTHNPRHTRKHSKKDHAWLRSRKKMLASTLHLTTTPADHHQKPPTPGRTSDDCPEKHDHPPHPHKEGARDASSSQDPTVCQRPVSVPWNSLFHINQVSNQPRETNSRGWSSRRDRP